MTELPDFSLRVRTERRSAEPDEGRSMTICGKRVRFLEAARDDKREVCRSPLYRDDADVTRRRCGSSSHLLDLRGCLRALSRSVKRRCRQISAKLLTSISLRLRCA